MFSPEIALHVVKLACERPDAGGRSLSQWDCPELAHKLIADGIVSTISPATIWRILDSHKLKPWRSHLWLSAKVPRDESFARLVQSLVELYTRSLTPQEIVISVDEKTNIQPRPRKAPTLPPRPGQPLHLEHEYTRVGPVHLFAAFDTRSGKVYARAERRKRQVEFIAFLSQLDQDIPASVTTISLVLDNASIHKGKQVRVWLAAHPRFACFFLPVHCSWMNQIEQWFSILQRKRLRISDFTDLDHLAKGLMAFVAEWNRHAHPFNWSTKSAAKGMAKYQPQTTQTEARMTCESSCCGAVLREETEDRAPAEDDPDGALSERLFTSALISRIRLSPIDFVFRLRRFPSWVIDASPVLLRT
jgi:hypothetical protein